MTVKVASLFAGVGGICQGFKDVGCKIVWANEIDPYACETYKVNMEFKYKEKCDYLIKGDICNILKLKVAIPDFDILCAGFPCQSFSIAGERKGFADERGQLFYRIMDVISLKDPQVLFLENVKNLVSHDNGNTFKTIKTEIEKKGYHIKYKILNSIDYGKIPQNRERIYIVAFKDEKSHNLFKWPLQLKLTKKATDFIDTSHKKDDKYYYSLNGNNIEKYIDNPKYISFIESIKDKDSIYQIRRGMYVRQNKKGVCPTLTANMGSGGHNVPLIIDDFGIRKLTPEECFRFQGFTFFKRPLKMNDGHLYKQAGNSVVVPVIKRIALNIIKAIGEE